MRCLLCVLATIVALAGSGAVDRAVGADAPPSPTVEGTLATAVSTDIQEQLRLSHQLEGSDAAAALRCAKEALAAARAQDPPVSILAALLQTGKMLRLVNDYAGVVTTANEGLTLATAAQNLAMQGQFHLLIATVRWNMANLPAASAEATEALRIGELIDDRSLQAGAENSLGTICDRNNDPEGSRVHLEAALRIAEQSGDPVLGSVLNNLGNLFLRLKDYDKARTYFEKSLAIVRGGGNQRLIAYLLINLGETASATGDVALANRYLSDAMELCERYKLNRGAANAHYLLAGVERKAGNTDAALAHLQEATRLAQDLKNPDLFVLIDEEYVKTEEARGDYRAALEYSRKLADVTETVRGEKSRRDAAQIQASYDAENRLRQIKLLQRDKELQLADLELKDTELSRARARYSALGAIVIFAALVVAFFLDRQRRRTRTTGRMLAEMRAAKQQLEEEEARKTRLLSAAEQDLKESEARFRNAFKHSPLGLALVSLEGRWMRVNEALCSIIGYTETELFTMTFQSITHPDDLPTDLAMVDSLLRGELETTTMDKRYIHKDGHPVWIRLDASLVRDSESGQPRYFVAQVQDITARRGDEEHLRIAKEEAERANDAKSEFLSRMSHELRTPLNAILGFSQLLELEDLGASQNQSVGHILTAGRHLLELINEVLDLSRIETGEFVSACEPVSVRLLTRDMLDIVRALAAQAHVELTVEDGADAPWIMADPRRIKQVLLNLLSNAIKYNRPGGKVTIRSKVAGARVRLEVADTGVGMAPRDVERAFAPFTRFGSTLDVPGTGLGLSLSKALMEAMDGTLSAESTLGVGSTFSLELAAAEKQAEPVATVSSLAFDVLAGLGLDEVLATESTVLYIEDNLINFQLVERLLSTHAGIRMTSATHGRQGLASARDCPPDLILLDVHLPDMDGTEFLKALRCDPATAAVPVIAISADATAQKIAAMRQQGAFAYLTKPLDIMELRRTIDLALSGIAHKPPELAQPAGIYQD